MLKLSLKKVIWGLSLVAMVLLAVSVFFPWWQAHFHAPQYPKGLRLIAYLDHINGDVQEINGLNHYIGMRPLEEGAILERKLSFLGIGISILGLIFSLVLKQKWRWIFCLPMILFPLIFATDLYLWMRHFGLNLDPRAPLSSSIKPFVPPLFGHGKVAQFGVTASFLTGFWLSVGASVVTLFLLALQWIKRRHIPQLTLLFLIYLGICMPAAADTLVVGSGGTYDTIQEAIQASQSGDTIEVYPGRYDGPIQIHHTLTLIGKNQPVIDGHDKGTVVTIQADNTVLRGFDIRGSGNSLTTEDAGVLVLEASSVVVEDNTFHDVLFGIYLRRASESMIRNNQLHGLSLSLARRGDLIRIWYSNHVTIDKNQTFEGRDVVLWFSEDLTVIHNVFQNGRYGLHFMYCDRAQVSENIFSHNSVGAYLMYSHGIHMAQNRITENRGASGFGVGFKDVENAHLEKNVISGNRIGLFYENSSGTYAENLVANNDIGIQMMASARGNTFTRNSLYDNELQVDSEKQVPAIMRNQWIENFWNDYTGLDMNQDRIGDEPYTLMHLFEDIAERYPTVDFFSQGPVAQALNYASRLFPIFQPKIRLTDERPRLEWVVPTVPLIQQDKAWLWIVTGISLTMPFFVWMRTNFRL